MTATLIYADYLLGCSPHHNHLQGLQGTLPKIGIISRERQLCGAKKSLVKFVGQRSEEWAEDTDMALRDGRKSGEKIRIDQPLKVL